MSLKIGDLSVKVKVDMKELKGLDMSLDQIKKNSTSLFKSMEKLSAAAGQEMSSLAANVRQISKGDLSGLTGSLSKVLKNTKDLEKIFVKVEKETGEAFDSSNPDHMASAIDKVTKKVESYNRAQKSIGAVAKVIKVTVVASFAAIGVAIGGIAIAVGTAKKALNTLGSVAKSVASGIVSAFRAAASAASSVFKGAVSFTKSLVSSVASYQTAAKKVEKAYGDSAKGIIANAKSVATAQGKSITEYLTSVASKAKSTAGSIASSCKEAINDMKDYISSLKKKFSSQEKALQKSQQKELKALQKAQKKELKEYEKASKARRKQIEKDYQYRLKMLDKEKKARLAEIDAEIKAAQKQREQEDADSELDAYRMKRQDLDEQLGLTEDWREKQLILAEISELEAEFMLEQERKKNEKIYEEKIDALENEKDLIEEEFDARKDAINEQKDSELEAFDELYEEELERLQEAQEEQLEALRESQEAILDALKESHDQQIQALEDQIQEMQDAVSSGGGAIADEVEAQLGKIEELELKVRNDLEKLLTDLWNGEDQKVIEEDIDQLVDDFLELASVIADGLGTTIEGLAKVLPEKLPEIINAIDSWIETHKPALKECWNAIKDCFIEVIKEMGGEAFLNDPLGTIVDALKSWWSNNGDRIKDTLDPVAKTLTDKAVEVGKEVAKGLWEAFKQGLKNHAQEKADNVIFSGGSKHVNGEGLIPWLKNLFRKEDAEQAGKETAEDIKQGVTTGINSASKDYNASGKEIADNITEGVSTQVTAKKRDFTESGKEIADTVVDGTQSTLDRSRLDMSNLIATLERQNYQYKYAGMNAAAEYVNAYNSYMARAYLYTPQYSYGYSHRTGLDYVPRDGYVAALHEGEKVLTKDEATDYREGKDKKEASVINNWNITVPDNADPLTTALEIRRLNRKEKYTYE